MKEPKPKPPVRQGAPMTLVMHARGLTFDPRGKRFALAEDGTVTSDSSACRAGGSGAFVVERITTARELIAALDGLEPGIVVVWGEPPAEIGHMAKSGTEIPGDRVWARSARHFHRFSDPAVLVIDCDMQQPPPLEDMVAWLRSLGFDCDLVGGSSASAGIRSVETGELVKDGKGLRLYALVNKGSAIPRILRMLIDRGWLCGWSHWRIGADGTPHERGAADIVMKVPVQADFSAAGAILGPGLTQDRTWRLFPGSERIQDVRKLAWIEDDETDYGGRSVDEEIDWRRDHARLMAEPEARKVKERYAKARNEERAIAAVAAGEYDDVKTAAAALLDDTRRELERSRETGVLTGWHKLHTAKGIVTCRDVIADPERWHMTPCAEPMEPTYNGGAHTSTILAGDRRPVVNSHRGEGKVWRMIKASVNLLERGVR